MKGHSMRKLGVGFLVPAFVIAGVAVAFAIDNRRARHNPEDMH